jgi:ABC-type sugar transport systems, permease components
MSRKKRIGREEGRAYWFMVLPALVIYLLVLAFPIVLSIVLSMSDYNGGKMFGGDPWGGAGLAHYGKLLADPLFWNALKNTIYIVLVSVIGQLPLGFILAYIIYRKTVKAPGLWQTILYLPNVISVIIIGILWQTVFSPNGPIADVINASRHSGYSAKVAAIFGGTFRVDDSVIARLLALAGPSASTVFSGDAGAGLRDFLSSYTPDQLPTVVSDLTNLFCPKWTPDFLNKPDIAMLPILFVILWCWTGLYLIIFLANMQKIDDQVIEAARIDGASERQIGRYVVLPALSGIIVNSAILAIAGSFNSFALIWAMTGGGPTHVTDTLAIYMYNSAFMGKPDFPLANAIALVMVLISFALIGITKAVERVLVEKEE